MKGVTARENQRKVFKSQLISYFIIMLSSSRAESYAKVHLKAVL